VNSRQRRHLRVFRHEVTLIAGSHKPQERYFEFEHRLERAETWLRHVTKSKNYLILPWTIDTYFKQTYKFRDGAVATMFALRWQ
jgi:hypothetical protein